MTNKTPIHKHSHPAYGWIALVVSVVAILGIAGWYYLTYSGSLNDDLVYTVRELSLPGKETSASTTAGVVDVKAETTNIDTELNTILDSDFSDAQLDNTILGIQ